MRLRPTPPVIPPDLLDRYGEPEHVFGPNMRFRIASAILGTVLLLLAVTFFIFGMADRAAQGPQRSSGGLLVLLSAGLLAVGGAAIFFPMSIPLNWVFVCPKGLVRTRGVEWDSVDWVDVLRFEDASLSSGVGISQQCRIVTVAGVEWGFLANWVAKYGRLVEVLRRKVEESPVMQSRPVVSQRSTVG